MQTLVEASKICAFIPGSIERQLLLRNLDLKVFAGGHLHISGENGSGKSTLLRLLHGDLCPASGSISWRGTAGKMETSRIVALGQSALVSPLAQEKMQRQAWSMAAGEWLASDYSLDPLPFSGDSAVMADLARDWLERLACPEIWNLPLFALSQGQMRLCLLARAFMRKPSLLLLDEYGDGIDSRHKKRLESCLKSLSDSLTMIVVSHRQANVPDWCEEMLELRNGKLEKPEARISVQEPLSGKAALSRAENVNGSLLFDVQNATVYAGKSKVLDKLCWQCRGGEHWRISGENGAGKSTFLRLLAGDEMVAAGGHAHVLDPEKAIPVKALAEKRRLVSLISDGLQACYAYDLPALELVCSGFDNSIGVYREFSSHERKQALEAIELFFPGQGAAISEIPLSRLSSGQARRLFIARALMASPLALLLDEPFSLLDAQARNFMAGLLERLGTSGWRDFRPTLIFVSHHVEDLPACVGREAEIRDGRLIIKS